MSYVCRFCGKQDHTVTIDIESASELVYTITGLEVKLFIFDIFLRLKSNFFSSYYLQIFHTRSVEDV